MNGAGNFIGKGNEMNYPDWRKVEVESTDVLNGWRTLSDLCFPLEDKRIVLVRKGFKTDLASIPRGLWNLYPPTHPDYRASAIMHDGLYASELLPRSECDWAFLCALQQQGNNWWTRNVFYSSVRCFGGSVWSGHTPESIAGARKFVEIIADDGV
jgi:hypothetical protein